MAIKSSWKILLILSVVKIINNKDSDEMNYEEAVKEYWQGQLYNRLFMFERILIQQVDLKSALNYLFKSENTVLNN